MFRHSFNAWLAVRHVALLCTLLFAPATALLAQVPSSERNALIAIYNSTAGGGWNNNRNWCSGACPTSGTPTFNSPGTECSWAGVFCNGSSVTVLNWSGNHLVGTLPDNLQAFSSLQEVHVDGNGLTGNLPHVAGLTNLRVFSAYTNQLTGGIPSLAGLGNLAVYNVFENQLTGPLPNLAGLTNLQVFDTGNNQLSGQIPDLASLTNLNHFGVGNNQLVGAIPSLAGLTQLQDVDFRNNRLTGSVPSLARCTQLASVNFSGNSLTGSIPSLAGLTQLTHIDFSNNQLSGSILNLAGRAQLREVDFSINQLSGGFPDLTGDTALTVLHVANNYLSGALPPDLSSLASLKSLVIGNNAFTGPLPIPPGSLAPGQSSLCPNPLTLSPGPNDNAWSLATGLTPWWGPLGSGCDRIPAAAERDALIAIYNSTNGDGWTSNDNWCIGPCPKTGAAPFNWPGTECTWAGVTCVGRNVTELQWPGNNLVGTLPNNLQAFSSLQIFDVPGNSLTGSIPSLAGLAQLQDVDFSTNQLTGGFPDLTGDTALVGFNVSDNRLTGPLPAELGALSNLQMLFAGRNQLSGLIPNLAGLTQLVQVDFSSNQLTGGFPDLTGDTALSYFDVSNNGLSGPLPADMRSLTNLEDFFVQFNRFTGPVPMPPASLPLGWGILCPNALMLDDGPNDDAWNAATGQTPWWGPPGGGCDAIAAGGFESLLVNGSFEHGLSGWRGGSGGCIWQTASAGAYSVGYVSWPASAPVDGDYILVSNYVASFAGNCTLYQSFTVPAGVNTATLSAAVGYNVIGSDASGCSVRLSVDQSDGTPVLTYASLTGGSRIELAPLPAVQFGVQPGQSLRLTVSVDEMCPALLGIMLDDIQLTVQ